MMDVTVKQEPTGSLESLANLEVDTDEYFLDNWQFEDIKEDIKEEFISEGHHHIQFDIIKQESEEQGESQTGVQTKESKKKTHEEQDKHIRRSPRNKKAKKCHLCSL